MNKKLRSIILMIVCTAFTSTAQILYKMGSNKLSFDLTSILTNWQIMLGLTLYALGAILVIVALRGGDVTVLYPIITTSYVWVAIGSNYFFREIISTLRWTGITLIIIGIITITLGQKDKELIKYTEPV